MLLVLPFVLAFLLGGPSPAQAQSWAGEDRLVTIGVLTITSKEEAQARWNPTADYLSDRIDGVRFEIRPLYLQEVARAVRQDELHFVHLQPLQFVQLRAEHGLKALATRVIESGGRPTDRFGSVIVRLSSREEIHDLSDLKGSIVAGVAPNALGAWILGMEEFERTGLSIDEDILPLYVGLPMDNVLGSVAAGRADAGVVRADVLTRAIEAGRYAPDTFTVLNPVSEPGYPHALSTRLVPQWPLAATSKAPVELREQVRDLLLAMPADSAPIRAAGLTGWTQAVDYGDLQALADRWLTPPVGVVEWLRAHWWVVPVGLSLVLALLLGQQSRARVLLSRRERAHRAALTAMHDAVITLDGEGRIQFLNPSAERLLPEDVEPEQAKGQRLTDVYALMMRHDTENFSLAGMLDQLASRQWVEYAVILAHGYPRRVLNLTAARMDNAGGGTQPRRLVVSMMDITELDETSRQLAYRAAHDELTGLLTRRHFIDAIDERLRFKRPDQPIEGATLLWLDIDHFRLLNEGGSHRMGDELVRRLAGYLRVVLPPNTPIGRLGGDEFGIYLPTSAGEGWPERILEAIRDFRFDGNGRTLRTSASIGVRHLAPGGGYNAATVIEEAESACMTAQNLGGNRLVVFEESGSERSLRQTDLAELNRLKEAVEQDRFVLHAQEIRSIGAAENTHTRLEVLLRLADEYGNLGSPAPLIELAERFNYMPQVDRWVVRRAIEELTAYRRDDDTPPARLMINLSGQSMSDGELIGFVREELQRNEIDPTCLCFEITETAAISNFDQAVELIASLREVGCQVALDDFGGGLISFEFLRHLKPDIVKIDGKLVRDLEDDRVAAVIVESIHDVARVMGARTVGEWVETTATLGQLELIGVDFAQGYLLHRPEPLAERLVLERSTLSD
ncbi:MAG: EAL domain-containing protein [Guyparkeria sp.]